MTAVEYGKENKDTVILLHGGGLSWWSCRDAAKILCRHYHVLLPVLDGHAGSDRAFTSIESNAENLIKYIDEELGASVLAIGGLSLGGQILVEMLSQRKDICRFAFIESAPVIPMKLTGMLIKPMLDMSFGLIKQKWFSKLQFSSLRLNNELYEEYYRDSCAISKADMGEFLLANALYTPKNSLANTKAKVFIFVGRCENSKMLRSACVLNRLIPGSRLEFKKGLHHGEFSIKHAAEYAETVISAIKSHEA